jgi:hypothetical protein
LEIYLNYITEIRNGIQYAGRNTAVYSQRADTFLPGIAAGPRVYNTLAYLIEGKAALVDTFLPKNTSSEHHQVHSKTHAANVAHQVLAEKLQIDSKKLRPIFENDGSSMVLFTNTSGAGSDDRGDVDAGSIR